MNVFFDNGFRNFSTCVAEYTERQLDGSDYDHGRQETIEEGLRNVTEAFSRLVEKLADKGDLSLREVEFVVEGYESNHLSESG